MKDEDQSIKEFFKNGMNSLNTGIPEFRPMMDKAVEGTSKSTWFSVKIAASVALVIAAGVFLVIRNQKLKPDSYSLTEWNEPTRDLMTPSSSGSTDLSAWSSPTDFLLPDNSQQSKN